jgi:hypothetical protein
LIYVFLPAKLEKREEQYLLGSKWGGKGRGGVWGRGQRRESSQMMYAHMNKLIKS